MTYSDILIQLLTSFFGTLGFSLLFNIRKNLLLSASIGGCLSWGIFLLVEYYSGSIFMASFLASAFDALYGEIMARVFKTPASVFFIPGVVPLIPGSALFNTCRFALKSDWLMFRTYGFRTLSYALGIACGLCVCWAMWYMFRKMISEILNKRSEIK